MLLYVPVNLERNIQMLLYVPVNLEMSIHSLFLETARMEKVSARVSSHC
jgi:hypothetical protein